MSRYWLTISLTLCLGCSQAPQAEVERPEIASTDFDRLKSVLVGIQPGEVTLFEGLPSAFWEPELRERERKQKQTRHVHGYALYEEPSVLLAADAEPLTALLAAQSSFGPYSVPKRCGEFSPEFCLQWQGDGGMTDMLISLECGEVKIFGPAGDLHCDLSPEAVAKLKESLVPRRKTGPEPTKSP